MQSFTVITDTPQRLATFLVNRGIIEQYTVDGQTAYRGVRPGLEFVQVSNPIVTDPGSGTPGELGYVPPTYDDRAAFLVKFAHESEAEKAAGFRDWLTANTAKVTAPTNYTINGEPAGDAYKVNGQNVWLIKDNPERFGVWQ